MTSPSPETILEAFHHLAHSDPPPRPDAAVADLEVRIFAAAVRALRRLAGQHQIEIRQRLNHELAEVDVNDGRLEIAHQTLLWMLDQLDPPEQAPEAPVATALRRRAADFCCPACDEPLSDSWSICTEEIIPVGLVLLSEDGEVVVASTENERLSEASCMATLLCCPCGQDYDASVVGIEVDWR